MTFDDQSIGTFVPDAFLRSINWEHSFTVMGEPASKENSRRLVPRKLKDKTVMVPIKSKKALSYLDLFYMQCRTLPELLEGNLRVMVMVWYASFRPDLDESLILDAMQDRIYKNDRQVKQKFAFHMGVDKANPRTMIFVGRCE